MSYQVRLKLKTHCPSSDMSLAVHQGQLGETRTMNVHILYVQDAVIDKFMF